MSITRVLVHPPRRPSEAEPTRDLPRPRMLLRTGLVVLPLALVLWGVWTYIQRDVLWQMLDLSVYHDAARVLGHNQNRLYADNFGNWKLPFIYPPFSAFVFAKLGWLGFGGLKWLMTVCSLISLLVVVWCSWGMVGYRRGAGRVGATLLTSAAALWFEPVQWTLIWGQVNLILLAVLMADLSRKDGARFKGVGVGIAAGVKLTPGIFTLYFLLTRRFREAAVSVAGFAATALLGWVTAPHASSTYWTHLMSISGKVNSKLSVGTLNNQSVQGMFMRAVHNDSAAKGLWLVTCLLLAALAVPAAVQASARGRELLGVVLMGTLSLLVSPISWSHHWVWVVPALVLLVHTALTTGRRLWWWAAGAFLVFYASWPMSADVHGHWNHRIPLQPFGLVWFAPRDAGRERRWNVWQFFVGNAYLLVGTALLVVVSWWILRRVLGRPGTPAGGPGDIVSGTATTQPTPEDATVAG